MSIKQIHPRISVDDLEQVLTKRKTVVDGKLVEV